MTPRAFPVLPLALVALLQLSCAAGNVPPSGEEAAPPSMPAARAGLHPEYRMFYDALVDYGDWTLIEPYGYVFRPDVNFVAWRPYREGFWVPSDIYGWVWVSSEPFGWITYHYGRWMYDRFEGWVWIPGSDWGPAWVAWEMTDDYVGWAPLTIGGVPPPASVPGGPFVFAPLGSLGSTDLQARLLTGTEAAPVVGTPKPVQNFVEQGGVSFNRGPSFERIERVLGHRLNRVTFDERPAGTTPAGPRGPRGKAATPAESGRDVAKHAAEEVAGQARTLSESASPPPEHLPLLRPAVPPKAAPGSKPAAKPTRRAAPAEGPAHPPTPPRGAAAPDSTR